MKGYDLLYIIKPHLEEEKVEKLIDLTKSWLTDQGAEMLLLSPMGVKDLSENFHDYKKGYFVHFQFKAEGKAVEFFKEQFRLNEDLIRHLIVHLDTVKSIGTKTKSKVKA